ncbi:MAG: NAD(P)/FAD-dependent oxidoreductase [Cyclobacteriaceae bacterium]|nr:NAD(P)/FAD-dependent oxidoreductase [Cyclobacteriaceae bacterium]
MFDLIVVGGGAAGFFGAIQAASIKAGMNVLILEKSSKLLAKVKVSGGGRCNVTHHEFQPKALAHHYPRGEKMLRSLFQKFQTKDVVDWFAERGIALKAEPDGRMFPITDSSQTIIDCFLQEATKLKIEIRQHTTAAKLEQTQDGLCVTTQIGEKLYARKILVATGGHPQRESYQWLEDAGHAITPLVPSLFTFNDSSKRFVPLMGVSVDQALVKIAGTKFSQAGPVLITHWGLSGPAVIKLSAWAAEWLHEKKYEFTVLVSWIGDVKEEEVRTMLLSLKQARPKLKVYNEAQFKLPNRLWIKLCEESEIEESKVWGEMSNRQINKLTEQLIRCTFHMKGKTTYKEEFVTCGGVDLTEVNIETMESKKTPGLFFAGEVLNLDGETGGFNFQAAWTTAWVAAQKIAGK